MALALLAMLLGPRDAFGGPRPYAYVQGIDSLSESGIELENWFSADKSRAPGPAAWNWWLGPVVGVSDQLEVGLFAIFNQAAANGSTPSTLNLSSLRLQVSYLLAPKGEWPIDLKIRGEVGQPIADPSYTAWVSAVASRDFGPLNLTGEVGSWLKFDDDEIYSYFVWALASSVDAGGGVRIGGELNSDTKIGVPTRISAGPSIAYGTGRLWLSANMGLGLTTEAPKVRGRLILGIAF